MQKYEAIIFDLGGTLVEYGGEFDKWPDLEAPGMMAAYEYLCKDGLRVPEQAEFVAKGYEILPTLWDKAKLGIENLTVPILLSKILREFQVAPPKASILTIAAQRYETAICAKAEAIPNSQEILSQLKYSGYKLGLISNTMFSSQAHLDDLTRFGMRAYFDATVFSADSNKWKPSPEPFLQVMNDLKSDAYSTLFVGDDPGADVVGAKAAGVDVVHFASSHRFPPAEGAVPNATINQLEELPLVIDRLNGKFRRGKLELL